MPQKTEPKGVVRLRRSPSPPRAKPVRGWNASRNTCPASDISIATSRRPTRTTSTRCTRLNLQEHGLPVTGDLDEPTKKR